MTIYVNVPKKSLGYWKFLLVGEPIISGIFNILLGYVEEHINLLRCLNDSPISFRIKSRTR